MEGKEAIIDSILASARDAAANIVSDAKAERDELVAATVANSEREGAERLARAQEDAAMLKSRRLKLAELDSRKVILAAKQQVIEKAYAQAETKILNMTDNVYRDFIGAIVSRYAEDGDEIVIAARDVKRLHYDWVDGLNKKLHMNLTLSDRYHNGRGGVILTNARYDKNLTVEMLVAETRTQTEGEVAARLFKR